MNLTRNRSKPLLLIVLLLLFMGEGMAQVPIPGLTVTTNNVNSFGNKIEEYGRITTQGLQYSTNGQMEIISEQQVLMEPQTDISASGNGRVDARIEESGIDVVWYEPSSTPGEVPRNEKLELGVRLPDPFEDLINDFLDDNTTGMNPFDRHQVDIEARFEYLESIPLDDSGPRYGFFYQDFEQQGSSWNKVDTDHRFRIRFTPTLLGTYRCSLKIDLPGATYYTNPFTFECVPSSRMGFVDVADNDRYLEIEGESFFPVGQNMPQPRPDDLDDCGVPWTGAHEFLCDPSYYDDYLEDMEDLSDAGANYMRMMLFPYSTGIEFLELGDYTAGDGDRGGMSNAYEVDRILEKAREIEQAKGEPFRIHFNMQYHKPFERPGAYGAFLWDWPAYDDEAYKDNTGQSECTHPDDEAPGPNDIGYCYSRINGVNEPTDFLTNSDAIDHYKNRLRYIVARWGYSPQIAVLEFINEINNIGQDGRCRENPWEKPYRDDDNVPPNVNLWHSEMAKFIKEDVNGDGLDNDRHPIAVSYTDEPETDPPADWSYYLSFVDIPTFNEYKIGVNKYNELTDIFLKWTERGGTDPPSLDKPMMLSEYGLPEGKTCDEFQSWQKAILLTPFTGFAGAALQWNFDAKDYVPVNPNSPLNNESERDELWELYGFVNDFFQQVDFVDGGWKAFHGSSIKRNHDYRGSNDDDNSNKKTEALWLENKDDEAIGAVQNRTINYYTQRVSSDCSDQPSESKLTSDESVSPSVLRRLKVKMLKPVTKYKIKWYNPFDHNLGGGLSSALVRATDKWTNVIGNLKLDHPELDHSSPILYFTATPADQLMEEKKGTPVATATPLNFQKQGKRTEGKGSVNSGTLLDTSTSTNWEVYQGQNEKEEENDSLNEEEREIVNAEKARGIKIFPNPTNRSFQVRLEDDSLRITQWKLLNGQAEIIKEGQHPPRSFKVDISSHKKGVYYILLYTKKNRYLQPIVKQ